MINETQEQKEHRYARIRTLKKWLKPLPRRTNIHKYPILKWFAPAAISRDYMWRLHQKEVIRGFYIGWIMALIPIYGLQMFSAFLLCFFLRGNCLVAMLLQWITNPITIGPIVILQYMFGHKILSFFTESKSVDDSVLATFHDKDFWEAIRSLSSGEHVINIISSTLLGGIIFAIIGATITTFFYKRYIKKHNITNY